MIYNQTKKQVDEHSQLEANKQNGGTTSRGKWVPWSPGREDLPGCSSSMSFTWFKKQFNVFFPQKVCRQWVVKEADFLRKYTQYRRALIVYLSFVFTAFILFGFAILVYVNVRPVASSNYEFNSQGTDTLVRWGKVLFLLVLAGPAFSFLSFVIGFWAAVKKVSTREVWVLTSRSIGRESCLLRWSSFAKYQIVQNVDQDVLRLLMRNGKFYIDIPMPSYHSNFIRRYASRRLVEVDRQDEPGTEVVNHSDFSWFRLLMLMAAVLVGSLIGLACRYLDIDGYGFGLALVLLVGPGFVLVFGIKSRRPICWYLYRQDFLFWCLVSCCLICLSFVLTNMFLLIWEMITNF